MSGNPAIHRQPSGDVDIALPTDEGEPSGTEPTPAEDPANMNHPEEAGGE